MSDQLVSPKRPPSPSSKFTDYAPPMGGLKSTCRLATPHHNTMATLESLVIVTNAQLPKLERLAPTVEKVEIMNCDINSLHIPPQVKVLYLRNCRFSAPITLSEGLEEIFTWKVAAGGSLTHWVFPSTLRHAYFRHYLWSTLDLRAVTAPTITLHKLGPIGQVILLPEALDHLVVDGSGYEDYGSTVSFPAELPPWEEPSASESDASEDEDAFVVPRPRAVVLPPNLRALTLRALMSIEYAPNSQTTRVKEVTIDKVGMPLSLTQFFPAVETMSIENIHVWEFPSLDLPHLRDLTIKDCSTERPFLIDAPRLDSLVIENRLPGQNYITINWEDRSTLGPSLKRLTLKGMSSLPLVEEWEALESLTLIYARGIEPVEVPYIQYLQELVTDKAIYTRDVLVSTIDEYKAAWGVTSRKKRAMHA